MTPPAIQRLIPELLLLCTFSLAAIGAIDDKKAEASKVVEAGNEIPTLELEALEKNLKTDSSYKWNLLEGDLGKAAALALAGQKHKPAETELWAGLLGSVFAEDQRRSQTLDARERQARYEAALKYLEDFSPLMQSEIRRRPDDPFLKFEQDTLNDNLATAAVEAGQLDLASALAQAILENNTNRTAWTYGNQIYYANTVLGRVALRKGDRPAAIKYLLESGNTPGSPQLNSIGPTFVLDRELLEVGEKGAVLQHLDLVAKFWANPKREDSAPAAIREKMDAEHARLLARWKRSIEAGRTPMDSKWR